MKRFFLLLSLAVWGTCFARTDEPLHDNPALRTGVLPNGMTYYILPNGYPQGRANFYFVQNAGAVLERDDQNGLAHFTEHMGFRGTRHFPNGLLTKTIERYGMAAARNINAWTTRDETVYYLSQVPTQSERVVDTVLLMLYDWSGGFLFDERDIEEERGVIIEEWRMRKNSAWRLENQYAPVLFNGTKYGRRDVIGDWNVLHDPDPEPLREFYKEWYRPDRQAVIVVGDFDAAVMEKKVKELFSTIPKPIHPTQAPEFPIPDRTEMGYVLATDPEATSSTVSFRMIRRNLVPDTTGDYEEAVAEAFYIGMLENRLKELVYAGDPVLSGTFVRLEPLARGYRTLSWGATVRTGQEAEGFAMVYTELERVRRYGFTDSELERARRTYLAETAAKYDRRDRVDNDVIAERLVDVFLMGYPELEIGEECALKRRIANRLTTDDIQQAVERFDCHENAVLIITGPDSGIKRASRDDLVAVMDRIENSDIGPYFDRLPENGLLCADSLPGGRIVRERALPLFGAEEWTLDNGAKVIYAHSTRERDKVDVSGLSFGGISRVADSLLPAGSYVDSFVHKFGLGKFDAITLRKLLAGKEVNCYFSIGELNEAVYGSAATNDFETFLQMLYLRFEFPRFDRAVFESLREREACRLEAEAGSPQHIADDSLKLISSSYHPRTRIFSAETVRSIRFDDIERVYRDRIRDASDFTFFIVGDIDADSLRPLVERYVGSIRSFHRDDRYLDHGLRIPSGRTTKKVFVDYPIPKAAVKIVLKHHIRFSPRTALYTEVLQNVLQKRLTTRIREQEGGTYSIYIRGWTTPRPREEVCFSVEFQCDPIKSARLKKLVYREFERISDEEVTMDEIRSVVKTMSRDNEQRKNYNSYVTMALISFCQDGFDPAATANYEGILDAITPASLRKFTGKIFDRTANVLTFTSGNRVL